MDAALRTVPRHRRRRRSVGVRLLRRPSAAGATPAAAGSVARCEPKHRWSGQSVPQPYAASQLWISAWLQTESLPCSLPESGGREPAMAITASRVPCVAQPSSTGRVDSLGSGVQKPVDPHQVDEFTQALSRASLPIKTRRWGVLPLRNLKGGGPISHALGIAIFRPAWWPPFFSTALFRPKILIKAKNGGASLPGWNVSLHLTQYEGPLPSLSQSAEGRVEAHRITE